MVATFFSLVQDEEDMRELDVMRVGAATHIQRWFRELCNVRRFRRILGYLRECRAVEDRDRQIQTRWRMHHSQRRWRAWRLSVCPTTSRGGRWNAITHEWHWVLL